MIRPLTILVSTAALASALLLSGCSSAGDGSGPDAEPGVAETSASPSGEDLSGTIVVDAASSLSETFTIIAEKFMQLHPSVTVTLNFGGSSALASDIVDNGAPVDVFAAASPSTMKTVSGAGLTAADAVLFARNKLEIATPPDNPGGITGLADFANPDRTIAICAVEVPCGAVTQKVFDAAGITPSADTYEQSVEAVRTKVEHGEAEAGLVYVTDVLAAGDALRGIEFPESDGAITDYPIAALAGSASPDVAQAFVDYVLSDGLPVLAAAGFAAP